MSGRSLHANGMGGDQLWRGGEGRKINAMKLHIQTCARGTILGSPQTFSFAAFDFLSLYNQPENDVLALKPSGGLVPRGNVTVRLRMVIAADTGSVRGVQKQLSVYE